MPGWTVLIPVKRLSDAKSRLAPPPAGTTRESLALAFALDTAYAASLSGAVSRVVAVSGDPAVGRAFAGTGTDVVDEGPRADLNAALRHAAALVHTGNPDVPLAALTADLPALRPGELGEALGRAAYAPRSFVPDAPGTGTVLLTALPGEDLDPRFGPGSAAAHEGSGAVRLSGLWPSLRRDVDTGADLAAAGYLGLGRHTLVVLLGDRRPAQGAAGPRPV